MEPSFSFNPLFIGSILLYIITIVMLYVSYCYAVYLLAKKYEPTIHPALSWIPIVNLYPLFKVSGKSLWWIVAFFVPLLNIIAIFIIYDGVSKRVGRGTGTTILLIIFNSVMLPWIALEAWEKKKTLAWVLGLLPILLLFLALAGFIFSQKDVLMKSQESSEMSVDGTQDKDDLSEVRIPLTETEIQEAKDTIKTNPDIANNLQEILKDPEFIKDITNPEKRKEIEEIAQYDINMKMILDAYEESIKK